MKKIIVKFAIGLLLSFLLFPIFSDKSFVLAQMPSCTCSGNPICLVITQCSFAGTPNPDYYATCNRLADNSCSCSCTLNGVTPTATPLPSPTCTGTPPASCQCWCGQCTSTCPGNNGKACGSGLSGDTFCNATVNTCAFYSGTCIATCNGNSHGQLDCPAGQVCCSTSPGPVTGKSPTCINSTSIDTAIGCIPYDSFTGLMGFILGWGIGIGGGIAFILIVVAGFQMMTSSGDPRKLQAAHELLGSAITGLIMLVFSVFILRLIGVSIFGIPSIH
jgi:hypothetical protein